MLKNEIRKHQISLEQNNTNFSQKLTKNVKKSKKSTENRQFLGTPLGSQPAFDCQPALRSKQNMKKKTFFCSLSHVFC